MDYRYYLSILGPAANSGNINVKIKTYNAVVNFDVNTNVAILNTDDIITTAYKIEQAIDALLQANSFNFIDQNGVSTTGTMLYPPPPNGAPVFSNFPPMPQFRHTRSDFVICMWSQAQNRIIITDTGATGLVFVTAPTPVYVSVAEALARVPLNGTDFTDIDGQPLSTTNLTTLLQMASDQLSKALNNKVVYSTYYHAESGRRTGSIKFRVKPGIDFDLPQVRRPYIIGVSSILITKSPVAYDFNTQLGVLTYRFTNDLIEISEPFDLYNEIKCTYTAGSWFIPDAIKDAVIQVALQLLEDPLIKSLKGSDFSTELYPAAQNIKYLQGLLREYVMN